MHQHQTRETLLIVTSTFSTQSSRISFVNWPMVNSTFFSSSSLIHLHDICTCTFSKLSSRNSFVELVSGEEKLFQLLKRFVFGWIRVSPVRHHAKNLAATLITGRGNGEHQLVQLLKLFLLIFTSERLSVKAQRSWKN